MRDAPDRVVRSDTVTILDVRFADIISIGMLVASLDLPNICELNLELASASDVAATMDCMDLFSRVTILRMKASVLVDATYTNVFLGFTELTFLDMTNCGPTLFAQLVNVSRENQRERHTTVMPRLEKLLMGYELPAIIKMFVKLHGATDALSGEQMTLREIRSHSPVWDFVISPDDTGVRDWIAEHILVFTVCTSYDQTGPRQAKWKVFDAPCTIYNMLS
ncbi:hypothetical protein C8R43DRAFT_1129966 [Mycena crocata]|nr:hypothetical protein C8R43DRAFT_1129966 [Mycena crocata]